MSTVRSLNPGLFTALWLLPVLALLQTSLFNRLQIGGALPSVVLIAVVDWGILRGPDEGMLWAFIGGFTLDMFEGWPIGTGTVAMVLVASLVSLGGGTFIRTHALLPPATVFAATLLYYAIVAFILVSTQHNVDLLPAMRYLVFPVALYNAILNIPGFRLVRRLEQRVYPEPRASW
ncbi:MAG TPA: rod shape-determining protein MreD [Chloroflexota bacterium]|nr:rod shape-determining protein MreD [Chloroflexota bacterium]